MDFKPENEHLIDEHSPFNTLIGILLKGYAYVGSLWMTVSCSGMLFGGFLGKILFKTAQTKTRPLAWKDITSSRCFYWPWYLLEIDRSVQGDDETETILTIGLKS